MVEGIFKCFNCDLGYNDLDEYKGHFVTVSHTHDGVAPCNQCGISTEYKFTGKLAKGRFPALCKSCKSDIIEGDELE